MYANFLYKQEYQGCKDSIVSNDAVVLAHGSVPTFSVRDDFFFLPATYNITATNNTLVEMNAIMRSLGYQFGADDTKAQAFPYIVRDIIANASNTDYQTIKPQLTGKLNNSTLQANSSTNFKAFIDAGELIIQKEANNAAYNLNVSNAYLAKVPVTAATFQQIKVVRTANQQEATLEIPDLTANALNSANCVTLNYQYWAGMALATSGSTGMGETIELTCYNLAGVKVAVHSLGYPVTLRIRNTGIQASPGYELFCAYYDYPF